MLAESARLLLRRWILVLLAFVLALAAGATVFATVTPDHQSDAVVLLVPPATQPGVAGKVNPFFSLGSSTQVMTTVVQTLTSDTRVADGLAAAGFTADYDVQPNLSQNAGPTLLVRTTDASGQVAQRTLAAVLAQIDTQLRSVQTKQGIAADLLITAIVLTRSTEAIPVRKTQSQLAIVAALGVLFGLVLLILLRERRRLGSGAGRSARPKPSAQPAKPVDATAGPARTATPAAPPAAPTATPTAAPTAAPTTTPTTTPTAAPTAKKATAKKATARKPRNDVRKATGGRSVPPRESAAGPPPRTGRRNPRQRDDAAVATATSVRLDSHLTDAD